VLKRPSIAACEVLRVTRLLLLALALSFPPPAVMAEDRGSPATWPLFANQETLQVRIEAPLTTLMRERSDTEYLEGTFLYTDASGNEQVLDLKLRARGKYRKQKRTCDLPPIRLNFRKKQVMGTEFAGQDKLKLVTHCENRGTRYEQNVLREYLAYKFLNALTPVSFGARLMHVDYVDSDRGGATDTRYAFLIEDEDLLAERIGAEVVRTPQLRYAQLDGRYANLVAVFEYMIGNTDFSMVVGARNGDCCHNTVPFSGDADGYYVIPYDFDFAGLVNAPYAKPNPKLPISRVRTRLYRGLCMHNGHLDETLQQFRGKRAQFREMVSSLEGLEDKVRDTALNYLDGFYRAIEDESSIGRFLVRKCLSGE
jgi:hypothetical protein